jgi:cysteine desulfurase
MHTAGVEIQKVIETYKERISSYFGCDPEGIYFCSSGSEAIHNALWGLAEREPNRIILTSKGEHSAVKHPVFHLRKRGFAVKTLDIDEKGEINLEQLSKSLSEKRKFILVYSPVNHETGTIQPVKKIFTIIKNFDCVTIIDGVQAASRLTPSEWVPFCDMFGISGHKLYCPKGTGLLWKKPGLRIRPTRYGGGQEMGLFPGTQNTPGIAALSEGIDLLKDEFKKEEGFLNQLMEDCIKMLKQSKIDYFLESPPNSVPGVLCLSFPWIKDMENFLFYLNKKKIYVSRFSACSSRVTGNSHILKAMGVSDKRASSSLRISLGRFSKREDLLQFTKAVKDYTV